MPNTRPALLILQPHLGFLSPILEADFTVWRFWEGPPLEAVGVIRALVVAGEFPIDKALAESLPNLGLIASFTAGYDGVDLAWARGRGLKVSHSPGVNHEDVADHALGLMLAAWRKILAGDHMLRSGGWRANEKMDAYRSSTRGTNPMNHEQPCAFLYLFSAELEIESDVFTAIIGGKGLSH